MKTIIYFFRHTQAGFSIEGLFNQLAVMVQAGQRYRVQKVYAPRLLPSLGSLWANLRFASRQKASLYHITGDIHYIALALPPDRTVLTIHDCVSLQRHAEAGNRVRYLLLRWLYYELPLRRLRYVTTISEKSRQELVRFVGPALTKHVRVVANHYNPAFTAVAKPFNAQRPLILHIGTAEHKNLFRLIEALRGIPCQLLVIGRLTVRQRDALNHSGLDYSLRAQLTTDQIIEVYRQSDLVSFVSTYEGFGMPILEANATGRAVLTSDLSPLREVAGAAAHLVDPHSVAAIRAGLLRLIEDEPYRNRLIERGYQNAARFTVGKAAQQYMALYDEVLHLAQAEPHFE